MTDLVSSAGPHREFATAAALRLWDAGHEAYFAGGCVRDALLGRPVHDFDIATSARPPEIARLFTVAHEVGAQFGVVTIADPAGVAAPVQVATFRADGPYPDGRHPDCVRFASVREDVLRRDFTINGLLQDPRSGEIIDLVGGRADLEAGIIRAIGDPAQRFAEDHLRLLRCVRFAARLGFVAEAETWAAARALAGKIHTVSAERIRDELTRTLTEGGARRGLELLKWLGLLKELLPEVDAMEGVPQPPQFHPEGDVWIHTRLLLAGFDYLPERDPRVAWACLLHDIGKPPTFTHTDRIRFHGHDALGAEMARQVLERLRFSHADADMITWLVRSHINISSLYEMNAAKRIRWLREPGFPLLLELWRLDALASHGNLNVYRRALCDWRELPPAKARPPRLLTGHDLINMGFPAGPLLKEILTGLEDAQLEARITTREDAEAYVRAHFSPP